ncbi:uncharacterized protein BP5553_07720 [Venustampulla echinocandica]|uniref:2EXR domain-containing protein n=1 Tax=Venustampulla echinocandica TaxID=2656787 RepID=A0A370THB9_9HELO|nr:uncharacterized protein BP5553_07720 [Venustampulla echinocandica]RDL34592.1 hypothetical protein BP5553_07720 [Venustampulla echinocandica]
MATFHPFPRLIPEIRTQIWALATEDRVIRVNESNWGPWSPSPVPAITRACRESRKHCSYQKSFFSSIAGGRYIWVSFDHDTIHVRSTVFWGFEFTRLPIGDIKHLRIELVDEEGKEVEEDWWYHHKALLRDFPKLKSVDLLVPLELRFYGQYIEDAYFGTCDRKNVRIVNMSTGEWFDDETAGPYIDYIESWGGEHLDCMTRLVEWDVDEESRKERVEDMKQLQMPRPRINLDYQ